MLVTRMHIKAAVIELLNSVVIYIASESKNMPPNFVHVFAKY